MKIKQIILKKIETIIKIVRIIKSTNKKVDNPYYYEDLMPKSDLEKNRQYCESIDWALKNKDIKNIALTGVYGSGKSTILKTYIDNHKEYKYLNISLASFEEGDMGNEGYVEKGILKQMFYKEKHESIPNSRFKKIKNVKTSSILIKLLFITLTGVLGILIIKPDIVSIASAKIQRIDNILGFNRVSTYLMISIFIVLATCIFIGILKKCINSIKIAKIETSIGEVAKVEAGKTDVNAFDKYIDEILYYFEVTKYDVVIFEDLDRFNDIKIFSKLRELNLLINNSEQIGRRVVFIYALKDDMFSDKKANGEGEEYIKAAYKNRVKFFDFIIPVVQVANSSNACDLLMNKLKESNQWDGLTEEFISDITILINDMRVLKNIYNEFVIYKENLQERDRETGEYKNNLDAVKILSMVVYKNIYPVDFAYLQNDEGMIYDVFKNKKSKAVSIRINQINEKIKELENHIRIEKKEYAQSLEELRSIYIGLIQAKAANNNADGYIGYKNETCYFNQLIKNEEMFENIIQDSSIKYYNGSSYIYINLKNEASSDYFERKKNIQLRNELSKEYFIKKIKKEINDLKNEKAIVSSLPLKTLFEKYDFEEVFDGDIKDKDLLKFLIKQGHINENYPDYISYFYEGKLTRTDKDFIQNVMYEKPMDFNFKLEKLPNILEKIHDYQFGKKYVLNYCLLDYIIENKDTNIEYGTYYSFIIIQLANESETSCTFIDGYINEYNISKSNKDIFIKSLCKEWSEFWSYLQYKSNYNQEKLDDYLLDILQLVEDDDVLQMNKNNILTQYISKLDYFLDLNFEEKYIEKVKELLKKLNVKFSNLNMVNENNTILDYIYLNDLYKINIHMIEMIMNYCAPDQESEKLMSANYTAIHDNDKCEGLLKYINCNINKYLENVFFRLESNINESVDIVLELINNEEIIEENKEKIIKKEKHVIEDITQVQDEKIWSAILINGKCKISWKNVINYYLKFKIDDIVIEYLNNEKVNTVLLREVLEDEFEENTYKEFCDKLIYCDKITDNSFKNLIKRIPYVYNGHFKLESLTDERIKTLIINDKMKLSLENYNNLRECYNEGVLLLIKQNINYYIEHQDDYILESNEILDLLNSRITIDYKIKIIENIQVEKLDNKELISEIGKYTLRNSIILDKDIIEVIIKNQSDIEQNILFLINQMDSLSEKDTFELLNMIDKKYSDITIYGKHPKIENIEINRNLVEKLHKKNFISSKTYEGNIIRINNKKNAD